MGGVGQEGGFSIARSRHLTKLQTLILKNNNLTGEAVRALAFSQNIINLTTLNLSGDESGKAIGDCFLDVIGEGEYFFNLTSLNIGRTGVTDFGIGRLASGRLLALKHLDLSSNEFTTSGETLLKSCIYLRGIDINTNGCRHLQSYKPKICH